MRSDARLSDLLLKLMSIVLLPGFQAGEIKVLPEVTGYLGHDVTLPCQFVSGENQTVFIGVEWKLLQPGRETITVISVHFVHGEYIHDSPLKGRLKMNKQSLIIEEVEVSDAGEYICSIVTFPLGSFEGTTKLVVEDLVLLSETMTGMIARMIAAGLFLLIVTTMLVTTHIIVIRERRKASMTPPGSE